MAVWGMTSGKSCSLYGPDGSAWAAVRKYHELGGFAQERFIVSQCRSLEVSNQGVGRAMLPLKPIGEDHSLFRPAFGSSRRSLACDDRAAVFT